MRAATSEKLEAGRIRHGLMGSTAEAGMAGAFMVIAPSGMELVIVSSGVDSEFNWEHVSVSLKHRTPNWSEMCFVKDMFWHDEECVVQFHPPKSEYVNHHPHCLHLWKPVAAVIPLPPSILVGPKEEAAT